MSPDGTERRHVPRGRRTEDHNVIPAEGVFVWSARRLFTTLGLIVGSVAATLSLGATVGLRWGPREDIQLIQTQVNKNTLSIIKLHETDSVFAEHLDKLVEGQHFQQYIQCVLLRKYDVNAVPIQCDSVVSFFRRK